MFQNTLLCLLLAGVGLGQSTTPAPTLKPRPTPAATEQGSSAEKVSTSPDTPVVTVQGLCERPGGGSAEPSDCKTVITRAEFEKVVNSVQPNMPPAAKKQFATRYVTVLQLAEKAHELGLDKGPDFDEQLYLARLQILSRLAGEHLQKEASQVSDSDIEEYYQKHKGDYKTVSFDRIYVPKQKQMDTSTQKPNDPEMQKKREASEAEMKEEADKLRTRAAAGEDFAKLQQEAYDFSGTKQKAGTVRTENVRKNGVAPSDAAIFELKKDEVSQVFNDPTGFMIYKVVDTKELPVASAHDEISRTLQGEKMKSSFEAFQNSVKTTFDESYFGAPAPPSLRGPGESPAAQSPPPGKK